MKKIAVAFLSMVLLLLTSFDAEVKADVLWEPSENFFDENNCVYEVENRTYVINSPDGFVNIYDSPDSAFTVGQLKNGETFHVYYKGTYKDKLWGLNTSEQYIPLDKAEVLYDYISFAAEYKDRIIEERDLVCPLKKGYLLWSYPGSTDYFELSMDAEEAYVRSSFIDEQGLKWYYFGYVYGMRNFWVCIDDPDNSHLSERTVNNPVLFDPAEPTQEMIKEAAKQDTGSSTIGSKKGITIVVACICSFSVIFLAAYLLTRKKAQEKN